MKSSGTLETILMTTDTVGGVWMYALELARQLDRCGIRVVLAAMGEEPSAAQRDAASSIGALVLESRPYRLEWMQDCWDDVREAGEWLLDLEAAHRPDLIHLNNYAHAALPWSAPVLVVGHSCVWSWFHAVRGHAPPDGWERYHVEVSRGLKAADAVTAPTRAMLSALRRHYGPFRTPGPLYNGRRMDGRRPLGRESIVLTAGRLWDEAKNVRVLDEAARMIEWPVFAAGAVKNPDGGEISFDTIRVLGRLEPEELGTWMGRTSIYALPARYEPFGLTALEAAQAGCALVLGDIPSLREVWGRAAVYVPSGDARAIAEAIGRLAADRRRLEEMAGRARRRARRFTPERMARSYLDAYARILPDRRRSFAREKSSETAVRVSS